MVAKLSNQDKQWYLSAIENSASDAVSIDLGANTLTYAAGIATDESHIKSADGEELVHAVIVGLLNGPEFKYPLTALVHEKHFAHGSKGSNADEVDILIKDADGLPYAIFEVKPAADFESQKSDAIKNQLFGTAPLVGLPKLLVYATVEPKGKAARLRAICIDYAKYKTYQAWSDAGEPHSVVFPTDYRDLDYEPYVNQGSNDLELNSTLAEFRAVAAGFHNEFFGEHPDNTVFVNLVKCLLAKIHDERIRKKGEPYEFQILYKNAKPESARAVFDRVNKLYQAAYKRYIAPTGSDLDEINPKEFAEERVKAVVQALQAISITKGAARHGDIIGAFFEEILRSGFKQDRGMYFTHDNIVRFMVEAIDMPGLTRKVWQASTHPDNRLPYVMDPACGSGTFLLQAMNLITSVIRRDRATLVADHDSEQFFKARLSDDQPNYWAENFMYGFDPKFIMAITAKVNMVLHGDGSAHIFKEDAFRPFSKYSDVRLRPNSETSRTVTRAQYPPDMCESFDAVLSNPPFAITIASETRVALSKTFTLPESTPSEGLFVERCFQLLRPNGRLAIVVPESLLNAKEMVDVRLFIYRFFSIRAIVSMPRNIFIDTPTLTSLLFAQKKTTQQVNEWDAKWSHWGAKIEELVAAASHSLRKKDIDGKSAVEVSSHFIDSLGPLATTSGWVAKGGKSPQILRIDRSWTTENAEEAAAFYSELLRTAGFQALKQQYQFANTVNELNYEFPAFVVDEVGYKLSKRKEKSRPNQLCTLRGKASGHAIQNLHLAAEETDAYVETEAPKTVLDFVRSSVEWT